MFKPIGGAIVGALIALMVGRAMHIVVAGQVINVELGLATVGLILGYSLTGLVSNKSTKLKS